MFDSTTEWMAVPMLSTENGAPPRRIGLSHTALAPYGVFQTSDERADPISIQNDREWATFCTKVLGEPSLGRDPRFASNSARVANRGETDGLTQRSPWRPDRRFVAPPGRGRIAFARVNDMEAILRHPHLRRLTIIPRLGPSPLRLLPYDAPDPSFGPLPALGAHTAAVRREFLD